MRDLQELLNQLEKARTTYTCRVREAIVLALNDKLISESEYQHWINLEPEVATLELSRKVLKKMHG